MKCTPTLFVACCSIVTATAQAQPQAAFNPLAAPARPATLLARATALQTAKTTATSARLVGAATAYFNMGAAAFLPFDSLRNTYSGGRGGGIDTPNADEQLAFIRSGPAGSALGPNFRIQTQFRTASGLLPATRTWQEWDAAAGTWKNIALNRFSYTGLLTADSLLAWDATSQTWTPYRTTLTERSAAGVLRQETILEKNTIPAWDTSERYLYQADGSGRYTQILRQDGTNGTLRDETRERYTYATAAAHPTALVNEYLDSASGVWQPSSQFLYILNGNGQRLTEVTMGWDDTIAAWDTSIRRLSHYDATGFLDSTVVQFHNGGAGGYRNNSEYRYTKNSYNLPATEATRSWDAAAGAWQVTGNDTRKTYYWEEYTPALAVTPGAATPAATLTVAPVPAATTATVRVLWPDAQATAFLLVDGGGRIVRSWQGPAQRETVQILDLGALSTGVYWLRAHGAGGAALTQRIAVVR